MERGWFAHRELRVFQLFHDSIFRDKAIVVSGHFGHVERCVGEEEGGGGGGERRNEMMDGEGKRAPRVPYKNAISADGTLRELLPLAAPRFCPDAFNSSPFPLLPATANSEIIIKPTSFQWNDGNYRVGCSRIPVSPALFKSCIGCNDRRKTDNLISHTLVSYLIVSIINLPG